jgi:prolyl oligopeptidase
MRQVAARYPAAERLSLVEDLYGHAVSDPYRWLEDEQDPRTISWLTAQEDLIKAERAHWQVSHWHTTLAGVSAQDTESVPIWRGERVFAARHRAGDDHPVIVLAEGGRPRTLLSPLAEDPSGLVTLEAWRPSLEGDLLACQLAAGGTEDSHLRVIRVADGTVVDGPIDRVRRSSVAWAPGGTHYYYVRRLPPELHPGEERYHRRVYLHQVGSDPALDVEVFGDGQDKTRFYSVTLTPDGRWLTIRATTGADPGTDIWLADLTTSPPHEPRFRSVQLGVQAQAWLHLVPGTKPGDPVWLRTTSGAQRGRIMIGTAPNGRSQPPWRELIAARPDAVLANFLPLTGPALRRPVALVAWIRHAVSEITVHDLFDGTELGRVPLPGPGTVGDFTTRPEGGHEAWFSYVDHLSPLTVLRYDAVTGQTQRWSASVGPDRPGVVVRQAAFRSRDGTTVRMFIVSGAGRPDRPRPAILTGYGGFGVSSSPAYSPQALAWARAGGVYAIACLRGGGEEGSGWHEDGRRARKQNTFDDFDAAADHLVAAGWTAPGQLGLLGRSNGGLLAGVAQTQHPDKYAAVVSESPLLDMVRYEQSGMGPSWRAEYGTARDPADLRVLLSYSPYHHVRAGVGYPATLFTVADGDTRVDPSHARKMCAALQHATAGTGPVLIRVERGVGHGTMAMSRQVARQAEYLAFLAHELGLPKPPVSGTAVSGPTVSGPTVSGPTR